jgi:glycosyltransferase involved in cell wall biosynthesis
MHPEAVAPHLPDSDAFPVADHPVVRVLVHDLRGALAGCTDCWVHNAFTVFLNPFLTIALRSLTAELPEIRWVAWCEDISSGSAYWDWPGERGMSQFVARSIPGVTYVTISEARRLELARLVDLPIASIGVIPPSIDALRLLGIGETIQEVATKLDITNSMPVVLVPAKLLPHKNLPRCVSVVAALRTRRARPLMLITAAPSPHEPRRSQLLARQLREDAERAGVDDCFHLLPDVAGELDHTAVRDLMLLSDVVFLPSSEEGYGLPTQEAAAVRVPVLCSRIPAFEESSAGPFFDADQTDDEIAGMILDLAESRSNTARRAALQSGDRFRAQLAELLRR